MTKEKVEELRGELAKVSSTDGLSVEAVDALDNIRKGLDEEDESEGAERMWEEKYKNLETDYKNAMDENARVTEAYRKRWNESFVGTQVNGRFVDKTVTDVSDYSYEKLLGGK